MKSNKSIFVQYKYLHGQSFSVTENIESLLEDQKAKTEMMHELWINDDSWMKLPKDEFVITTLTLDKDGDLASVQFSERYT